MSELPPDANSPPLYPYDANQPPTGSPPPASPYPSSSDTYPAQPFPPPSYPPSTPYGYPSQPAVPAEGYVPLSQPAYPPGAYPPPSQPWPTMPDAPATIAPAATGLAQPLPLWSLLVGWAAVVVALIGIFITGSDWAAGAQRAGIAAAIIGVLVLIGLIVRGASGMFAATNLRRNAQITGAGIAIFALLLAGGAGIGLQSPIHHLQGSSLESQQQWQQAIGEFTQGGASAPSSEDLARVYNEWGEKLNANGQFQDAITKYELVISTFASAPTGLARAQKDDATAYYEVGEKAFHANDNNGAVSAFKTLTTRFPNSPEATKAHADYATALFNIGDAQLSLHTSDGCDSALTAFQDLAANFADTPDGQKAAADLALPRHIQGSFTGTIATPPSGESVDVFLLLNPQISATQISWQQIYSAPVQANGSFVFKATPFGAYSLLWGFFNPAGTTIQTKYLISNGLGTPDGTSLLVFNLKPLCSIDYTISGNLDAPPPASIITHADGNRFIGRFVLQRAVTVTTRWMR